MQLTRLVCEVCCGSDQSSVNGQAGFVADRPRYISGTGPSVRRSGSTPGGQLDGADRFEKGCFHVAEIPHLEFPFYAIKGLIE